MLAWVVGGISLLSPAAAEVRGKKNRARPRCKILIIRALFVKSQIVNERIHAPRQEMEPNGARVGGDFHISDWHRSLSMDEPNTAIDQPTQRESHKQQAMDRAAAEVHPVRGQFDREKVRYAMRVMHACVALMSCFQFLQFQP